MLLSLVLLVGVSIGWMAHNYWAPPVVVKAITLPVTPPVSVAITKPVINTPRTLVVAKPAKSMKKPASKTTKPAEPINQNAATTLIKAGKTALAKGDYLTALNAIEQVLAQVQDDYPQADLERFFIETSHLYLQKLGDTNAVAVNDFLLKAVYILPDYLHFRYLLGQSLLNLGDLDGADYQLSFLVDNQRWKTQFTQLQNAINYAKIFKQGDVEIQLIKAQNAWHIIVVVDDQPARFILDTGASITTVSEHLVNAGYSRSNKAILSTANGKVNAFRVNINTLSIGDITRQQFPVVVLPRAKLPASIDGLLGLDWLSNFNFIIDAQNSALRLSLIAKRKP